MERTNLCKNLKQHNISNKKDVYGYNKVKDSSSWDFVNNNNNNNNIGGGGGGGEVDHNNLMGIFPWPPRSYSCTFCKREFRSAQALGGHMNVHRRDRARLRHYSPPPPPNSCNNNNNIGQFPNTLNLNLDPNPSFNSNPSLKILSHPQDSVYVEKIKPLITTDLMKIKGGKGLFGVEKIDAFVREKALIGLDLEIGLISQSKDDELDLELRLGYT
ncbi:hypothetical protein ACJIZ3_013765 [Penstemon smallii]|uniref:C2H2-type domain-containing protein n=1 Tax=Penstemon smallii TaxID=265156 RepID=A0ABD3RJJ6_9LAMI